MIAPEDLSSFFCTGGTTGTPKIAMRRHANEVANAWSVSQVLGDGMAPGKTIFCGLPLFHVNAVLVTGLLPFSRGAHVILGTPQGYRGDGVVARFWEIVEHHRISFFSGVPTLYASLLQQPLDGRDIGCLEYGLCGAAPMPLQLMRTFQEKTGLKILEGYGLTEGTCVSTVNPPRGERRLGSVGLRVPLQAMKAVVLDEAGAYLRDCAVDEVGVLVIRGPNVFAGYKVAEHNAGLWLDAGDGGPWLNTGDLGRQDADGYFYLTGRKKELIIRGGHNIDPASIEQPLHQHPAVLLAAAVGRPDAHAGEVAVAYVQLKPGADATEAELMSFARDRIGERAAVPEGDPDHPGHAADRRRQDLQARAEAARDRGLARRGAAQSPACPSPRCKAQSDPTHGTRVDVALAEGADPQSPAACSDSFRSGFGWWTQWAGPHKPRLRTPHHWRRSDAPNAKPDAGSRSQGSLDHGQTYPAKTITLLVTYPPGGPADAVARAIAPALQRELGQAVIVDNIGGVGGALGAQKRLPPRRMVTP